MPGFTVSTCSWTNNFIILKLRQSGCTDPNYSALPLPYRPLGKTPHTTVRRWRTLAHKELRISELDKHLSCLQFVSPIGSANKRFARCCLRAALPLLIGTSHHSPFNQPESLKQMQHSRMVCGFLRSDSSSNLTQKLIRIRRVCARNVCFAREMNSLSLCSQSIVCVCVFCESRGLLQLRIVVGSTCDISGRGQRRVFSVYLASRL